MITILYAAILAATISSDEWGLAWENDCLPSSVSAADTPGSSSFVPKRRLTIPAYYAWMDGYDFRAVVSYDIEPDPKQQTSRRLAYFSNNDYLGSFLSRKDNLRNGMIVPWWTPKQTIYWSDPLADIMAFEGPAYADFDWMKNPIGRIYDPGDIYLSDAHTRFCLSYSQLSDDELFPMAFDAPSEKGDNPFQKMLHDNAFGLECYHNDDQAIYDRFSRRYVSRSDWAHTTFDDFMSAAFGAEKTCAPITNTTHRLIFPTLAAADQALSLFTRSYRVETPVMHITKAVRGSGQNNYEAEGTISCTASFNYATGEADIDVETCTFETPTETTNYIAKADVDNPLSLPVACSAVVTDGSMSSSVIANPESSTLMGDVVTVTWDEVADVIPFEEGSNEVTIDCDTLFDDFWRSVRFRARKHGESTFLTSTWRGFFTRSESATTIPVKAFVNFAYSYLTALNKDYATPHDYYPSYPNDNYVESESWYLFSSFCFKTNRLITLGENLRSQMRERYMAADDYGFRCVKEEAFGPYAPYEFGTRYRAELQRHSDKCLAFTGTTFYTNAKTYLGSSASKVRTFINDGCQWEASIQVDCYESPEETGVTLVRDGSGHITLKRDGSSGIVAATAGPLISGRFTGTYPGKLPEYIGVETYMGIVTEIDWDLPQVKRSN